MGKLPVGMTAADPVRNTHLRPGHRKVAVLFTCIGRRVSLLRAVLFFHPLVWLAARRIELLAEHAADDAVLEATGEPVTYAKLLARFAEELPRYAIGTEVAAGILFNKGAFLRRVEAILSDNRDKIKRLSRVALLATLLAAVLSLGIALALPLGEKTSETEEEADAEHGILLENLPADLPDAVAECFVTALDGQALPFLGINGGCEVRQRTTRAADQR